MSRVVLASRNAHKIEEMARILAEAGLHVEVVGIDAFDGVVDVPEVPETEPTFEGNALLKARAVCAATGVPAVADDSGLCVDALDGRPGVLSARYGGPGLDDRGRLLRLLDELRLVPPARRTAHFTCSLCVCGPDGGVLAAIEERCEGTLLEAPAGSGGFGYDPIFVPREFTGDPTKTFAVLDAATKDRLSHRGKALRALLQRLPALLRG